MSGRIATQWGNNGFQAAGGDLELRFKGSAGQSFGAFNLPGVSLRLEGEANDYVGKGINGGQIVIVPHRWETGKLSVLTFWRKGRWGVCVRRAECVAHYRLHFVRHGNMQART